MSARLEDLLAHSATSLPGQVAVIDGDRELGYRDLEDQANQVAHLLIDSGMRPGDRVGLYLKKSVESLVGIYGVLKARGIYVPLDPDAPPARLVHVARDCELRYLLTAKDKAAGWTEIVTASGAQAVLVLDAADDDLPASDVDAAVLGTRALRAQSTASPPTEGDGGEVAYLLYTSGSTGTPKGIALTHRNALAFVDWAVERFGVVSEDRLSSHAPLHFDLSIFDVFAAAHAGATVVLVPPTASVFPVTLAQFIEEQRISVWYSVPSILTALALRGGLRGGEFPRLRAVLFAGEVFPVQYLRELMSLLPHARFYNLYGPTETNVCTYYEVPALPPALEEPVPIGKPIAGVDVFVLTEEGELAPSGEVGELYVQGPTVMQGYWKDGGRTSEVLREIPVVHSSPLAYKTGDLVREDDDGNLRFLGRRDAQIKSRGYRIELGDIEAALYAHEDVLECAVLPIPDDLVTNRIKAFVVRRDDLRQSDLAKFCGDRVPRYMVPEFFEFRDSLPKTSTGKIDRQQLKVDSNK